ncbi:MAG: TSUP family transporter, partial [bacterium]|nr:TSUP family transporter [bacterium]
TSVAGALIYILISPLIGGEVLWPDWWLGLSFGVGGAAGIYVGARVQRYVSPKVIKVILVLALLFIAVRYILGFYLN